MIEEAQGENEESRDKNKSKFNKELSLFEINLERTPNVVKLHKSMQSIVPTSVEAARTFSAAGLFVTKLRSRLGPKNIDALSVLRTHVANLK